MIDKLLTLNNAVLRFMTDHIAKIMGLVIVAVLGVALISVNNTLRPETAKEFASTSVKILNTRGTTGGSGVILTSTPFGSKILTNKHVCRLIETGGYVMNSGKRYTIDSYKKYPKHDLCLLSVIYDFKINTTIASTRPDDFSNASVSGHPGLMPSVLTNGYFSGRDNIKLIVGLKKCDKDTPKELRVYCFFFGAFPLFETFSTQLVTATILPGSSGSGVFNEDGELTGLVFAGRGKGLTYAYIVPHEYLIDFMRMESEIEWSKAGAGINYKELFRRIFNFESECDRGNYQLKNLCNYVQRYSIWRSH